MPMQRFLTLFAALATLAPGALWAQATTVQLPNFNFSTVTTTVTAPDGGTVLLGGISRLSEGSVDRGVPGLGKIPGLGRLFKNRGIGRETSASTFTVTPRIIILEEEEERQVGRPLDRDYAGSGSADAAAFAARSGVDPAVVQKAALLSRHIARSSAEPLHLGGPAQPVAGSDAPVDSSPLASAEQIRRTNELAASQRQSEAGVFFAKGRQAALEGRTGAAKVYYNMAARRSTGEFHEQILAHLEALQGDKNELISKSP
ncbi:type II and III secretion system protein [Lignipirellula cremea]|uniref:Outer membrane porin HofQ n=1 Tax=Lignipirellula cremea TaxID=2528010 RepID=A0A518DZM1_9BACT|nr:type II and III secretion system protein [Lignipirellula cremea]QDU97287.1 outer membrane porin HofQ [Lignipirellula cremea]